MMQTPSLTRATIIIMLLTLLGSLFGFAMQMLTAHYFGTSKELDAFIAASIIPFIFFGFTNGSFMTALVYVATKHKLLTHHHFNHVASALINSVVLIKFLTVILLLLIAPTLSKFLAPGFSAEQLALTTQMIRILSGALFFLGLTSVTTGLLYTQHHFSTPTLLRSFQAFGVIVCLLLLKNNYSVYALAIGTVIGCFLAFIAQFIALVSRGFQYTFTFRLDPFLRKELLKSSFPLWMTTLFYYLNKIINNNFASWLPDGSISTLNYAYTLTAFPAVLIPGAVATAIFPHLTKKIVQTQHTAYEHTILTALRTTFFVLLPITIITIILRQNIITLLLERGRFDATATARTATALAGYALGMYALGAYPILANALIALGEIRKSTILMLCVLLLNTALNFAFLKYSTEGLAFAASLTYWLTFGIGILLLKHLLKNFPLASMGKSMLKMSVAAIPATFFLIFIHVFLTTIISILIASITGISLYIFFSKFLRIKELKIIQLKIMAYHGI